MTATATLYTCRLSDGSFYNTSVNPLEITLALEIPFYNSSKHRFKGNHFKNPNKPLTISSTYGRIP